jgi:nitrogen regulatory protein P-II 1
VGDPFPASLQGGLVVLRKIECYIQPFKLEDLTEALVALDVDGMSVTEIKGFGRQRGHLPDEVQKDASAEEIHFLPKLKIEIVVGEEMVDEIVNLIVKLARTGTIGAGKVFVVPVEDAIRIGTGEVGYTAIE